MAAATTTALAGAAGSAEAKRPERDAEFDAIENRMLDLGKRGTTLSTNQKYFVLLAVATAVAAEGSHSGEPLCRRDEAEPHRCPPGR